MLQVLCSRFYSHLRSFNFAFLSFIAFFLAGCSAVEFYEESRYLHAGEHVPAAVFSQITPKQTTQSWVLDYLGEPSKKIATKNGSEHWVYPLLIEHRNGGRIILLYSGVSVEQESRYFHLLLNQGVVDKAWYSSPEETLFAEPASSVAVATLSDSAEPSKMPVDTMTNKGQSSTDGAVSADSKSASSSHASTIKQSRTVHKP